MFVELRIEESVAYLTLNRPEKRNAYHKEMLDELDTGINTLAAHQDIKVLLIGSSSNCFCAGADLKQMAHRSYQEILNLHSRRIFDRIQQLPLVTIAAVKGYALAGGFELALACDFIVAETNARFGLPEIALGLIPAAGGIDSLVQRVGIGLCKEIILAGRQLTASEAWAMHLVTKVASDSQFDTEVNALVTSLVAKPIEALQIAKIAINEAGALHKSSSQLFGQALLQQLKVNKAHKTTGGL